MINKKKNLGQYFTKQDIWLRSHIKQFIFNYKSSIVIDPFAGAGDILNTVSDFGCKSMGYDIDDSLGWAVNNSLEHIPSTKNGIVVTNPPFLAKNAAKRMGLDSYKYFKNNRYQDLYQIAIEKVLNSYEKAVFIIPETFIQSSMFVQHLHSITIIEENPFSDTECPICVCCFDRKNVGEKNVCKFFKKDLFLFYDYELYNRVNKYNNRHETNIKFNKPSGNLGLRGIDGVGTENRIRFCLPQELDYNISKIKVSSRAITIIDVDFDIDERFISILNTYLEDYRMETHDVLLSAFKNNNKNGVRRRRLDFALARKFINKTIEKLIKR